jgi:serine/threonine protein kinase
MHPEQLTEFSEIGKGRFKTVSSGCHSKRGHIAILRYTIENNREAAILAHLSKHGGKAHFPEVYGLFREPSRLTLAQELSSFGSVRYVLQDDELGSRSLISVDHKLQMAKQFVQAVSFLRSARAVHTDIACRNFLIFGLDEEPRNTNVKLTDFACAFVLNGNKDYVVKKLPQATRWCSPETIASDVWGHATDIWSLGATLWECFTCGKVPWTNYMRRSEVAAKLRELARACNRDGHADLRKDFPAPDAKACPMVAHRAALSCLQINPSRRPSPIDLVQNFEQIMTSLRSPTDKSPKAHERKMSSCVVNGDEPQNALAIAMQTCFPLLPKYDSQEMTAPLTKANLPKDHSPSTMCPSTPELESLSPSSNSLSDDSVAKMGTSCGGLRRASQSQFPMTENQKDMLENIHALWVWSNVQQDPEALARMKVFLSSPEAVCGLSVDKLIYLRSKLAAAQLKMEENCLQPVVFPQEENRIQPESFQPPARGNIVYRDSTVPLSCGRPIATTGSFTTNSTCSVPSLRGSFRCVSTQAGSFTTDCSGTLSTPSLLGSIRCV